MLPKIELPTYELKLPSTGKVITVRPFVVKEEKLLLMALESGEEEDIIQTTKQIVNNCIMSKIKIDDLPFFDMDYIFIFLRAKSVGDSIDIKFTCNNEINNAPCGEIFTAKIDITNYKVVKDDSINSTINISGKLSIKMKYPSYSKMRQLAADEDYVNYKDKLITECIDMVIDGDKVHTKKDYTPEEFIEFIGNLPRQKYSRLEEFVDNFPNFVVTTEAICPKCKFNHKLEYSDFTSFFV